MTEDKLQEVQDLKADLRYLKLLAESFPTANEAATEVINLEAILNLPKGTEHFLADVHGEYEAFVHVLKNASGSVRRKVEEVFGGQLRQNQIRELCTLIYYPREKLDLLKKCEERMDDWYMVTLNQLVKVCLKAGEKYTRSKVRKTLPVKYQYIIQELLHEDGINPNKSAYLSSIFSSIIATGRADDFIVAISETIQRLVIDHLHLVGDIYDRGPGAHIIMDSLQQYKSFDIQWGNHDILWMGAAVGNQCCMANVLRIALRYANLDTLENGYGINMLPLARFAMETYADDPCTVFKPKLAQADQVYDDKSVYLISQMHKAIAIIQFKLEQQLIARRPEYRMDNRNLMHRINFDDGTITIDMGTYPMVDTNLPTVDPKDPYKLTEEEEHVVKRMTSSFIESEKLQKHVATFYNKGSLYLTFNGNLLYHASIPLNEDKSFKKVQVGKNLYSGKALLDKVDEMVRLAYASPKCSEQSLEAIDYMWYLWCGPDSPLFDKSMMTTFERYFIADKATHHEAKGFYYTYRVEKEVCEMILKEFDLEGPDTHIINGHVPVKAVKGEKPIVAGGKLVQIDGGFSRAYQSSTGIAGYTLIFNSQGLQLVQHEPFSSTREAIEDMEDIKSITVVREFTSRRMLVKDTDNGKLLAEQVANLKKLLTAYRFGLVKERIKNYGLN